MAHEAGWQERVEAVFDELAGLPEGEREARLGALSGGDASVAAEVRELLRCLGSAPAHLEGSVLGQVGAVGSPGDRLGGFRVVRLLGEGGMGQVFEAEQDFPSRRVALKVIRSGMATEAVLRRFEVEATALAQLRHPGIAQIYEAGSFEPQGLGALGGRRPYFAMELVEGRRLDEYAAGRPWREVLSLVAGIADAVQHAHQRGIIHRDLKPSNILVEGEGVGEGGGARCKVLDFGVARLAPEAGGGTLVTEAGQLVGTVAYMSPEQLGGSGDVDTRSDVYALGVILYQLLAGRLPHEVGGSSLYEAARAVMETDPPALGVVRRELRGDVSTIVGKAMERDRERRYATAAELAADLRRFLAGEPVQARPATAGYLALRFAGRHKGLVAAAAAFAVLVTGSGVAMSVLYRGEQEQRRVADAALERATREVSRQKATLSLLVDDAFGEATPSRKGHGVRVVEVLDGAAAGVQARFPEDPGMRAHLRVTLGHLLWATGQPGKARAVLREAAGEAPAEEPQTLASARLLLGMCEAMEGHSAEALAEYERAIEAGERGLPGGAETVAEARMVKAEALQTLGRHAEAEPLLRGFIAGEGSDASERPISARLSLAASLMQQGKPREEGVGLGRGGVAGVRARGGAGTPLGLAAMNNYAGFLLQGGRKEEGAAMAVEVMRAAEKLYPPTHPDLAYASAMAASTLLSTGKFAEAREAGLRAVRVLRATLDESSYEVERLEGLAAEVCGRAGDVEGGLEHYGAWLRSRLLAAKVEEGEGVVKRLADLKRRYGQHAGAGPGEDERLGAYVDACVAKYGPGSERRCRLLSNLARGLVALGGAWRERGRALLGPAREALSVSGRVEEDRALLEAVEKEASGP